MCRVVTLSLMVLFFPSFARADFLPCAYGVFGAEGMTINGATVENGLTGSNGSITAGSFTQLDGVVGGGTLTFNGNGITGPVTFNGDVTGNTFGLSGTITGAINTGGTANLAATVTGSLTAANNVNLAFTTLNGPILAGGNVLVGGLCTVNGPITANGTITNNGTISGTSTPSANAAVTPLAFTPVSLPTGKTFTSGGSDVAVGFAQSQTLAPGSYGNLTFNGTVTLTTGTYYFNSIQMSGSFGHLNFDLSNPGSVRVYVTGNISMNQSVFENVYVNGVLQTTNLDYAQRVYFESATGNIEIGGFNLTNTLLGTYYAPEGNLTTDTFTNLDGNLYATGMITLGDGVIVAIPEPASGTLLGLVLLTGALMRVRHVVARRRAVPENANHA